MHFEVVAKTAPEFYDWLGQARGAGDELTPERYIELSKQSVVPEPFTFRTVADGLFDEDSGSDVAAGPRPDRRDQSRALACGRGTKNVRQAELGRHSLRPAHSPVRGRLRCRGDARRDRFHHHQRLGSVSVERMDHQRRSQADRHHVCDAGRRDAAARLHRRDHDALAASDRVPVPGLSAAGALQPDLLRPWHDHDLLRRHAVRDRADELRHAAAAWNPRRRLPDAQFGQLLAHCNRRAPDQHLAGGWRVRTHRLASVSAPFGIRPIRPESASTITYGASRFPASGR